MTTLAQRSFAGGVLSPSLYARTDTTKYATGARTLRNTQVKRSGGTYNRAGTAFVGYVPATTQGSTLTLAQNYKMFPWAYDDDQTYVMLFSSGGNVRFVKNGSFVLDSFQIKTITAVSTAAQAVFTSALHSYSNGAELLITGLVGITGVNNKYWIVSDQTTNTYKLKDHQGNYLDTTSLGTYVSGGTSQPIYQLGTTYANTNFDPRIQYLKAIQSAEVMTVTQKRYQPREITRVADDSWAINLVTFGPSIAAPTSLTTSAAGSSANYFVTAVRDGSLEESLRSAARSSSQTSPTIGWAAVTGALYYNVYRVSLLYPNFGYIGSTSSTSFVDDSIPPDSTKTPIATARDPFPSTGNYPACCGLFQQRRLFGQTVNAPETVWATVSGGYSNFNVRAPTQEDDAITFTVKGKKVNTVHHLIDVGSLLIFTKAGEWASQAEVLTPFDINLKQFTYNGSSEILSPIVCDGSCVYVQERGSIVRDVGFDYTVDGYRGNDLTIFANHLFDGYEILSWDYQKTPNSTIWAVRDDGKAVAVTYIKEQQIIAWHIHDTDGQFNHVCCIPRNSEDEVYFIVTREVDGTDRMYVERLTSRTITEEVTDAKDMVMMDAAVTYDGRNTSATTMTLSGGTTWDYMETLTITASAATFAAADVGKEIHFPLEDGTTLRFVLTAYTSTTVMSGKPQKTVPVANRSVATTDWAAAIKNCTLLEHLEGKDVSVLGDGMVVASPYNSNYDIITVTGGEITLPKCYSVIHVGLPYISDLETLNIDLPGSGSIVDESKIVNEVFVQTEKTRGLFIGPSNPDEDRNNEDGDPLYGMTELKVRQYEGYDSAVRLITDTASVLLQSEWNSNGRIFLRQVDPLPCSILAVFPKGDFALDGGGQ